MLSVDSVGEPRLWIKPTHAMSTGPLANAQTLLGTKELIMNMNPMKRTPVRGQALGHDSSLAAVREFAGEGSPVGGAIAGSPSGSAQLPTSHSSHRRESPWEQ